MDCYFDVKSLKENYMKWARFLAIDVFCNKYYRWTRIFTLIFYITVTLINIYFFITIFETNFFYKYISTFLAILSSIIINGCLLWLEKRMIRFEKGIVPLFWSIDCTTKETKRKITGKIKIVTPVVLLNTLLGVFAGFVLIPLGKEQEYQFPLYFSRTYLTSYHYIFDFIYFITFPVTSYLMVAMGNFITYLSYMIKCQLYLELDLVSHMSAGYEDKDNDTLFYCKEYQDVIRRRGRFAIQRHNIFLKYSRMSISFVTQLLPWCVLGFLIMSISALSYVYLVGSDESYLRYWHYFQNLVWAAASTLTGALLVQAGQEIEDQTGAMFNVFNHLRWTSFNNSNKKTLLIILTVGQVPIKLRFTDEVSLNYELGIRVVRNVYSFAAIFARVNF